MMHAPLNTATIHTRQVEGRTLAYLLRGLNANQRAIFATRWDPATDQLVEVTDTQLAALFGISRYQLKQARGLDYEERWAVQRGSRRLSTRGERLAKAIRVNGVEATWDALTRALG